MFTNESTVGGFPKFGPLVAGTSTGDCTKSGKIPLHSQFLFWGDIHQNPTQSLNAQATGTLRNPYISLVYPWIALYGPWTEIIV